METTTSFDLNRAIQQWRENLGQSPAFQRENLNELESHLRDSVAVLQTCGLSAEEAFLIATRRIGKGGSLETEFSKVNGTAVWLDRFFWMVIGYQVWVFLSGTIAMLSRGALFFGLNGVGYNFKAHGHGWLAVTYALVQLAGFAGSLALCWWLFRRKAQSLGRSLERWLQHRGRLALLFVALYLLSLSLALIGGGMHYLMESTVGREKIIQFYSSQGISALVTTLITTAVFPALVLLLARKRLRLLGS